MRSISRYKVDCCLGLGSAARMTSAKWWRVSRVPLKLILSDAFGVSQQFLTKDVCLGLRNRSGETGRRVGGSAKWRRRFALRSGTGIKGQVKYRGSRPQTLSGDPGSMMSRYLSAMRTHSGRKTRYRYLTCSLIPAICGWPSVLSDLSSLAFSAIDRPSQPPHSRTLGLCESYESLRSRRSCAKLPK
jgi:hypothetical protein